MDFKVRILAAFLAAALPVLAHRAAHAEDAFLAATPEAQKSYERAKGLRAFGIVWGSLGGAGLLTSIAVGYTSLGCSETGDLGCLPRDIGLVIAGGASVVLFLIPGLISLGVGSSRM